MARWSSYGLAYLGLAGLVIFTGYVAWPPAGRTQPGPELKEKAPERFDELSAAEQDRLRHNARYFLALPSPRRDQVVKLDQDLRNLSQTRRQRLEKVLFNYVTWLEGLSAEDRQKVQDAPDAHARLAVIRKLRAEEWLKKQPVPLRAVLAKLPAEDRLQRIQNLRQEEKNRRLDWVIARRFWDDLMVQKISLPAKFEEFPVSDLSHFVKEYLQPLLSWDERERLQQAEGKWPTYPRVLVELADAHPQALLGPHGPRRFDDLPDDVRKLLAKTRMDIHYQFVKREKPHWPNFAKALTAYVANRPPKNEIIFPYEMWPYRLKCLSEPVRQFIDKQLRPALDADEKDSLQRAETQGWPVFPDTIQRLAQQHGMQVPWLTLPGPQEYWDKYRLQPRGKIN